MKNISIMKPYFDDNEIDEIKKVLDSGWVAQGPKVQEFEALVAEHEKIKYAVATTSCTTALHLTMVTMGLNANHDIIIPSYTFIATANAAEYTGATPILADVDPKTYNIDPTWVEGYIEKNYLHRGKKWLNIKTGKKLFGIVPVNLFGLCADIPAINKIAKKYNLLVLEDSACALGATINGVHQSAFGNPACLSFHPRKSITTGEGGMILTDNQIIADKARKLRSHAAALSEVARHQNKGYLLPDFDDLGYNYRMNDIQAAVGVAQMKKLDKMIDTKIKNVKLYNKLLKDVDFIVTPFVPAGYGHTYQSYVCMVDNEKLKLSVEVANKLRNKIMGILENKGISTRQGTHAVHTLGYYKNKYGYKPSDLPSAYKCDRLSIALPLYHGITDLDQKYVVNELRNAFEKVTDLK